jgi:hypothetical protein
MARCSILLENGRLIVEDFVSAMMIGTWFWQVLAVWSVCWAAVCECHLCLLGTVRKQEMSGRVRVGRGRG